MNKKIRFFTAGLGVFALANHVSAQSLNHAVRKAATDLESVTKFVSTAAHCFENAGHDDYQKSFCKNNNDQLLSFSTLQNDYENDINKHIDNLNERLEKKPLKDTALLGVKEFLDNEYKECIAKESGQGPEIEETPKAEKDASLAGKVWSKNPQNTITLLDAQTFNDQIDRFYYTKDYLDGKEYAAKVDEVIKRKIDLRKKMFAADPQFAMLMLSAENASYSGSEELFWESFRESTGIKYDDASEEVKRFVKEKYKVDKAIGKIYQEEDKIGPERVTLVPSKNGKPVYKIEALENDSDFYGKLQKSLGYDDEKFSKTVQEFLLNPTDEDFDRREEIIEKTAKKFEKEISELGKLKDVLNERLKEVKSREAEKRKNETYDDGELYTPEDSCQFAKEQRIRAIAEDEYIVNFYSDKNNQKFMKDRFNDAKRIMNSAVKNMNLSSDSKQKVLRRLDEVKFILPNVNKKEWGEHFHHMNSLIKAKKEQAVDMTFDDSVKWARDQLSKDKKYNKYMNLESSSGVNAYYFPDDAKGFEREFKRGHHVGSTCGLASKKMQLENPDAYLSVMAHELGHALDPSFSEQNKYSYSAESLKRTKALRDCLNKNNKDQFAKGSEDFADHLEAYFVAEWLKEGKGTPEGAMTRQRLLHFNYSNICEGRGSSPMQKHSDDLYRFAHVYSHPDVAKEFSELPLPQVPFCSELLNKRGEQR